MSRKKIVNFILAQEFLSKTAGDWAIKLVKICEKKGKGITDEEIGKSLKKLKITEIRTILNQLHYRGIATYTKTRNQKTGWYTYTWEIKPQRVAEIILEEQAESITKLEKQLKFQGGHAFFSCSDKCSDLAFEIAAEYQFKCPECSKNMDLIDNKKFVLGLQKKIKILKTEIVELQKIV